MNIGHFYHNLQFCTTLLLLIMRSSGPREKKSRYNRPHYIHATVQVQASPLP